MNIQIQDFVFQRKDQMNKSYFENLGLIKFIINLYIFEDILNILLIILDTQQKILVAECEIFEFHPEFEGLV